MHIHYRLFALGQTVLIILASTCSLDAAPLQSAPSRPGQYYYEDPQASSVREMRDSLESVKHSLRNQETEIRTFEEKLENLDTIIESVRDQISDTSKSHKDQLKGSSTALETKLTSLETSLKGVLADMKQFQIYSTESTTTLTQYKKKITELEKAIEIQNQNIDDMQTAMKSLMELLQIKSGIPAKTTAEATNSTVSNSSGSGSEILYKIKEGDSLEKIAKAHQTTIKAIKELNGLTTDRIVVGRTLKIPQP